MLTDVVDRLACPHCGRGLELDDASSPVVLRCESGHDFDVARQGYVSLRSGGPRGATGDSAEMVTARQAFLDAGHYAPLTAALAAEVERAGAHRRLTCVLDVGAGTGHYLAAALNAAPGAVGVALDASKPAARRAAHCHPRVGSVLADAWRALPLGANTVSVALTVFAPRAPLELRRVLTADGTLVVATPTPRHLVELVESLDLLRVDERKPERLADAMAGTFVRGRHAVVEHTMVLDHAAVSALVEMGPSAWHRSAAERAERVRALPEPVLVTSSVQVSTYRPAPSACA